MIAFDADVLTDILVGHPEYSARAAQIPVHEQAVPIVVIEEILRGRLNAIRQAEAAKTKLSLDRAYLLFEETLDAFRSTRFRTGAGIVAGGLDVIDPVLVTRTVTSIPASPPARPA